MKVVGRFLKIFVLLLVVVSVTTILLTPTLTDDVPGVMHRSHSPVAVAVALCLLQAASLVSSHLRLQDSSGPILRASNFLELFCQHLC